MEPAEISTLYRCSFVVMVAGQKICNMLTVNMQRKIVDHSWK